MLQKAKLKMPAPEGNKLEQRFALHLAGLEKRGEILWWQYEPIRLRIGKGALFTPDFGALRSDSSFVFFETKGSFTREASRVRLKAARDRYPFFEFRVARLAKGGGWEFSDV